MSTQTEKPMTTNYEEGRGLGRETSTLTNEQVRRALADKDYQRGFHDGERERARAYDLCPNCMGQAVNGSCRNCGN